MNLASASGYIRLFLIQRSQYNDQKCHIVGQRKLSEMPIFSLQLLTESAVIPFIFMEILLLSALVREPLHIQTFLFSYLC